MGRQAAQTPALRIAAALQLEGEHQHRQLGLPVACKSLVAVLPVQVVEVNRSPEAVGEAAQVDDPRAPALHQQWQELRRQGEVAQVVRLELQLETIGRDLPRRRCHDAAVVDQGVQHVVLAPEALGKALDRSQAGEIQCLVADGGARMRCADVLQRGGALFRIAPRQDDLRPGAGQCQGRLVAQPPRSARDDHQAVPLRGHVPDAPACHAADSSPVCRLRLTPLLSTSGNQPRARPLHRP